MLLFTIRNIQGELNDIRFEFVPGKDTAQGIAAELVGAGLVDGRDMIAVAANLDKIIMDYSGARVTPLDARSTSSSNGPSASASKKTITFALNAKATDQVPSEKALVGFAQLTITD